MRRIIERNLKQADEVEDAGFRRLANAVREIAKFHQYATEQDKLAYAKERLFGD